jgi:rSAM/selenodomain-associated transferase 1
MELAAQDGDDLGARMSAAFERAFAAGARRVALVGTDVPALSRAHVEEAFTALGAHDVVLGPAADGGYYLIALSRARPELFRDLPWGAGSVADLTQSRAAALGLTVARLAVCRDVDTMEDLRACLPELGPALEQDPALARALDDALRA